MIDQRLKIAVFIDFDNIEIGVKTTLHTQFDIAAILEGIKERGEVVTKVAYGDWKRAGEYGRLLSQHAIQMVQRNLTPGGDKNGADINLALDALEMAFTHDHINAFVIVGGDSDFITLVEKLKQYDKKVFVVGGRQFTSQVMQKNCHEFIAYENLVATPRSAVPGPRRENGARSRIGADVSKAIPLVKRALKVLSDREVSPQLGLLKSTLLQLDSTFSERDYGVSTFRDFIEKLAKTGLVTLRHAGRSMMVDSVETDEGGEPAAESGTSRQPRPGDTARAASAVRTGRRSPPRRLPRRRRRRLPATRKQIQQMRRLRARHLRPRGTASEMADVRAADRSSSFEALTKSFDERKWGFSTIVDHAQVRQREGMFRLERDRRGQMRVFAGATLQRREQSRPTRACSTSKSDFGATRSRNAVDISTNSVGSTESRLCNADVIEEPESEIDSRLAAGIAPEVECTSPTPEPVGAGRIRARKRRPHAGGPASAQARRASCSEESTEGRASGRALSLAGVRALAWASVLRAIRARSIVHRRQAGILQLVDAVRARG